MYKFFCLLDNLGGPFSVKIDKTETVDDLRKKITQEKRVDLADVDADHLNLYLGDIPTDKPGYMERAYAKFKELSEVDLLSPLDELEIIFESPPARQTIHILIRYPRGK
jgi:hypothetical protein